MCYQSQLQVPLAVYSMRADSPADNDNCHQRAMGTDRHCHALPNNIITLSSHKIYEVNAYNGGCVRMLQLRNWRRDSDYICIVNIPKKQWG